MALFDERVARNEALFREVNEHVEKLAAQGAAPAPLALVCECGDGECSERIDVPVEAYERVRANPRWFLVRPHHVIPEIEHVVEETPAFTVVEKDTEVSTRIAERHDPRA